RIQFHGAPELVLAFLPHPVAMKDQVREVYVGLGQVFVQFHRLLHRRNTPLINGRLRDETSQEISMAERSPREGILRISSNRLPEVLDGFGKSFRCAFIGKPATLEVSLVSFRNHARCASETNLLFR